MCLAHGEILSDFTYYQCLIFGARVWDWVPRGGTLRPTIPLDAL